MKKRSIFVFLITLSFTLTLLMSVAVNASGKLSEYDFSKWILSATKKLDFEDKTKDAEYNAPGDDWVYQNVAGNKGFIREAGGTKYLECNGFSQLILKDTINTKYYVFSADIKSAAGQNVALFARSGNEKFFLQRPSGDPGNDGDYFEQDRSAQIDGQDNLGGSGFYLKPNGNKLRLFIKLYDTTQDSKIGNKVYDLDAGVDFSTGFYKVTLVDDGASVSIYVGDALVAKIAFSVPKKYTEIPTRAGNAAEDYYSKIVITNAAGTELGTHTNAIFAVKSNIAFGNRNNQFLVDNIELKTYNDTNPQTFDAGMTIVFASILSACLSLVAFRKREAGF